jgi:hypothetical protein
VQVYGDVERTVDCYRRALEIGPPDRPSLYINLAGVLDQMDFVHDALLVPFPCSLNAVVVLMDACVSGPADYGGPGGRALSGGRGKRRPRLHHGGPGQSHNTTPAMRRFGLHRTMLMLA